MEGVNIASSKLWPKQGNWLNLNVKVCFNYDTAMATTGVIVRDDAEEPYRTIIKLDNGLFVLAQECQYSPL